MARNEHLRARYSVAGADDHLLWRKPPVADHKKYPQSDGLTRTVEFEVAHTLPGVEKTFTTFPWLTPLINKYFDHSPEGAIDSLKVSSMVYQYAYKHPERFTSEQALLLAAAGVTHDVGKIAVDKDALDSSIVYTNDQKVRILGMHVKEGFDLVKDDNETVALIIAGHHFFQDDRVSYPDANEPWVQTDDPFVHEARRVLIVADRVDALKSKARPYKSAYTDDEVFESLWNQGFQEDEAELVSFMLQKQQELAA